jgi:hypothetical protein
MTRPHPVTSKARTRKPEPIIREITRSLDDMFVGHGNAQILVRCLRLLLELRRSLRDTRGAK